MYYPLTDKIVATAPRVASRSTRAALGGVSEYSRGARNLTFDDRPVILFVRDPIERFESGFRQLVHSNEVLVNYVGLVDAVLDGGYGNLHFTPQYDYHNALFSDDFSGELRMYPFEDINELWPDVVGVGTLPVIGAGSGPPKQEYDYRRDELLEWFVKDMELRSAL